jgi:hypothetical protein
MLGLNLDNFNAEASAKDLINSALSYKQNI